MSIETRLLRSFVAVAEQRSFTRAAGHLHIAQQALSSQIQALEADVGVRLLERTTRRVDLTAAGEVFLVDARDVLMRLERAVDRAQRAAGGQLGHLTVAYSLTTAYEVLPAIVNELREREPDLAVAVREVYAGEMASSLADGRVDIALTREPEPVPGLERLEIHRESWVVVLPPGHRLAGALVVRVADLAAETIAVWPRELSPGFFDAVQRVLDWGGIGPTLNTRPGGSVVWAEIASGRAVAITTASIAAQRPNGVVLVALEGTAPPIGLSLMWRTPAAPAVRRFVEVAEAVARARRWLPGS